MTLPPVSTALSATPRYVGSCQTVAILSRAAIRAKRGEQSTVFTQLQPGRYALFVIHDVNDDGRLNRNAVGVPIEGYGFGNNAQASLSAPSFDAAAITVGNADIGAAVALVYPTVPSAEDQKDYNKFIGNGSSRTQQR